MLNLFNFPHNLADLLVQVEQGEFDHLDQLTTSAWIYLIQARRQWNDQQLARALRISLAELRKLKKHRAVPDARNKENYTNLLLE